MRNPRSFSPATSMGTPVASASPPHISPPTANRNQMERWLAAEPIPTEPDAEFTITLRADQGMRIDLRRLVITHGSEDAVEGDTGAPTATGGDLSFATAISSILVKNALELVRGSGDPVVTFATWSPTRGYNQINLSALGQLLRLEANETISFTATCLEPNFAGVAQAAVPCILDCDIGKPAYAGFNQNGGSAVLGSDFANSSGVGEQELAVDLEFQEAGILDISNMQIATYNDGTVAEGGNVPLSAAAFSKINSIIAIDKSQYIVGSPDNSGNDVTVPVLAYTVPSYGKQRANPWCRLASQPGTSGNAVEVGLIVGGTSNEKNGSNSAPFYPRSGGPLDDCK